MRGHDALVRSQRLVVLCFADQTFDLGSAPSRLRERTGSCLTTFNHRICIGTPSGDLDSDLKFTLEPLPTEP